MPLYKNSRRHLSLLSLSIVACEGSSPSQVDEVASRLPPLGSPVDPGTPPASTQLQPLPSPAFLEPTCEDSATCCPPGTVAVLGTSGSDVFNMSSANRCYVTLGGDDVVNDKSPGGFHAAIGGPGDDVLHGGTGPVLLGTSGSDVFNMSSANRCYVTLGGDDVVNDKSPGGFHAAIGGPGDDVLHGGTGPVLLAGGGGNDSLKSRNESDELYGHDGNDILVAQGGADKCYGGPGDDTIQAGKGDNQVFGDAGADTIHAENGNDLLRGGPGEDVVNAGAGDDFVYGDADNDTLNGGSGNDVLIGGHGRDTIQAGQGDDTVIVLDPCELEAGEVLSGGAGTDTLRIPIPLVEVQALGIAITGFESIIVDPQSEVSECGKCGCTVAEGVLSCCSGEGTCDAEVGDG